MTIEQISDAFAHEEGLYVTAAEAKARGIRFPTRPQRNCNPGNVRIWRGLDGKPYPKADGYVDFLAWAREHYATDDETTLHNYAIAEGWRVLRKLLTDYLAGHYTDRPVTLRKIVAKFAPANDGNAPEVYTRNVAERLGIGPDDPLEAL